MSTTENPTQIKKIIELMIRHKEIEWFSAADFQEPKVKLGDDLFVGWEASARMSDILRLYPEMVEAKRQGKFRVLRFRFENIEEILRVLHADMVEWIYKILNESGVLYVKTEEKKSFMNFGGGKYEVPGSRGKSYTVSADPDLGWICNCPAYRFSPKKTCKHIKIIQDYRKSLIEEEARKNQRVLI